MSQVWSHIYKALQAKQKAALISVIGVAGSTPREVGARIVLVADELNEVVGFYGTIGGGNLENNSLELARKMLATNKPQTHIQKHLLGPDMGQCCGGAVQVLIEVFTASQLPDVIAFREAEKNGEFYSEAHIDEQCVSRKLSVEPNKLGLNSQGILAEKFGQKYSEIYLFGAGHVGKALMLTLASLPFNVTWVDSRKGEFPKAVPPNFTLVHMNQPHNILQQAPDNAQIFILTHNHDIDFEIASTALQMERFSYVGMIGSKTKKARFISKFKKLGLSQAQIDKLHSPIGIAKIKSKKPQAIAISVVAEILTRIDI